MTDTETTTATQEEVATAEFATPDKSTDLSQIPNTTLDALFAGEDTFGKPDPSAVVKPPPPAKKAAKKVAKETPKPEKPAAVEQEDEDGDGEEESDTEVNFDGDIEDADDGSVDEDDPENVPEGQDAAETETIARQMAKKNGKLYKTEKATREALQLEHDRQKERADKAEAALKEVKATKIRPQDDPEYSRLREEVLDSVETQAELLPEAKDVVKNFGYFVGTYLDSKKMGGEERRVARDKLKQDIIASCGRFDVSYDEMSEDERREADTLAAKVLQIVVNNAPKTEEMLTLGNKLASDAELGTAVVQEREYKESLARIQSDLDALGDLDDETIAENPHAIEAIIAAAIKDSPAAKKRSEDAKDLIRDVLVGPRALSQKEREKLKANGTDMKAFEATRKEKHQEKVKTLIKLAYRGLLAGPLITPRLAKLAKLEKDTEAEHSEEDVVRRAVTKPKKATSKGDERPSQRQNYGAGRFM